MRLTTGIAALVAALAFNFGSPQSTMPQEKPRIPEFFREYEKVSNVWTFLFPSHESVFWKSQSYKIHNSPVIDVNEFHGFAGVSFESPKLKNLEISLGFITKVYSRKGNVERIENIVYEYDDVKRNASFYDIELARKNNIPVENLMNINHDVLDVKNWKEYNPENDSTFSVPSGVVDFQYGFFKFRDYLKRNNIDRLDTNMTFLYKHSIHDLSLSVFREDDELKVSMDLTVPSAEKSKSRSLVPGLDRIVFTLDENYLPSAARGEGTVLFVPISVEVKVKE